jgi:hypothetical protein
MKISLYFVFVILMSMLTACQRPIPPPPLVATKDVEFTLAPGQTAMITGAELTIKLISVSSDERCPSEIECAASGPVTLSISVQKNHEPATDLILQTFTSNDGRSPDMQFEGIEDRVSYEGYLIRVVSVLPYPVNPATPIKDAEYRVSLVVSEK